MSVGAKWPVASRWDQVPFRRLYAPLSRPVPSGAGVVTAYTDGQVTLRENRNKIGYHEARDLSGYQGVEPGDLVVHGLDILRGSVGVSDSQGAMSSVCTVCTPLQPTDSRFVSYVIRSQADSGFTRVLARGIREGGADFRRWDTLGELPIILPPLEEQRRIADFLDEHVGHIAKLVELRHREVEVLEASRRDALLELIFSGRESTYRSTEIEWLPEIPTSWGFVRARFLCDITTGSGDTVDAVDEGEFPFYVRSDRPERSSEFTFDTEAVLTSGDGAGVGKVFHHVIGKFHAHQRVYVLHNFRRVFPRYFFHYFSATFGKVALDGSAKSTVDSVRRDMLAELPVALPHITAQKAISAELDDQLLKWREAQQALKESIGLLDEYRRSLITAAVTGELDVPTARRGIPA